MKTLHFALSVPNQKTPRGAGHFSADAAIEAGLAGRAGLAGAGC